ncbi:predicted protein [Nematostella vectensis]|uniref:G-protein coupled receptors family 1 profile domain-containing protein n=1 Tax=Nematostella vectensis TaxID=45351 RepID=A7RF92_NEMVE|nr:apelin receptor [Nematostella vectensis]EDO49915.1 predicted protein [Nematostella vectensis]|eukprot:XP_001641978.1 predicted protein [Nematostella vectensis]
MRNYSYGLDWKVNGNFSNETHVNSSFTQRSEFPRFLSLLLGYYGVVVLIVSLAGNMLALAACSKTYHRNPSVLLGCLASLTVADLLFVLLAAFDAGIHFAAHGDMACKVEGVLTETCYTALILVLVLISYERMQVVSSPILARVRRFRFRKWLPLLLWLISLIICSPLIFFFHTSQIGWCENTALGDIARQIYYGIQSLFLYTFSLLFMIWAHCRIFRALAKHSSFRKGTSTPLMIQSERKLTRMLVAVTATFCLCYSPYITVRTLKYFKLTGTSVLWRTLWRICELFVFTQAAINPFIFCFFSRQYRKACKEILRCECRTKKKGSPKTRGVSATSLELKVGDLRQEPTTTSRVSKNATRDIEF